MGFYGNKDIVFKYEDDEVVQNLNLEVIVPLDDPLIIWLKKE